MLAGLVLLEALSLCLFSGLLLRQQGQEVNLRARLRLSHQATSLAMEARSSFLGQGSNWVGRIVQMIGEIPGISMAKVTDAAGHVLSSSNGMPEQMTLDPAELAEIPHSRAEESRVFVFDQNRWEAVRPIYIGGDLRGFAWVETDRAWDHEQLVSTMRAVAFFGVVWMVASALLVLLLARSISRPLAILHRGTRSLMESPGSNGNFPLPVQVHNEIGDLIEAFNRMFASIVEQRAGLSDTLSLLDSMLANAPIGLAFFDQRYRFVRVNQAFAGMTGVPMSRHLGRTLPELLPAPVALELQNAVVRVFAEEDALRNVELSGQNERTMTPWTWLVSVYPVRTMQQQVRWAGVIVLDASERKRSEEALRKSEKLAAAGRLATSIAHEINNPLEAITNLLFLLHNFCALDPLAQNYVIQAEHEAQRISEITQQTLRFYRQSTLPLRSNMAELLDSVLNLYRGRLRSQNIRVERDFDQTMDLFCFSGEIRQVFANLIGNAIDAMGLGGRLVVRARRSRNWKDLEQVGIRFAVADTGSGMGPEVQKRIFEAFYTTKEETGTGLGLWVSEEIIRKHKGMIHLRSRPLGGDKSSGTIFEIFIPDVLQTAVASGSAGDRSQSSDLHKKEAEELAVVVSPNPDGQEQM
jgi:PAS domain S-box-containing protein